MVPRRRTRVLSKASFMESAYTSSALSVLITRREYCGMEEIITRLDDERISSPMATVSCVVV